MSEMSWRKVERRQAISRERARERSPSAAANSYAQCAVCVQRREWWARRRTLRYGGAARTCVVVCAPGDQGDNGYGYTLVCMHSTQ